MKKLCLLISVLILTLGCQPDKTEDDYKFGAVLPLTGDQAFYGAYFKEGMELAVQDINAAGGINGKKVMAIYEDTGSNKLQANNAAQKLISADKADALFTVLSGGAGIVAPLAEANKVPLIYHSATDSFALNKTYVFKDYPSAIEQCKLLTQKAIKDGHKTIALYGVRTDTLQLCKEGAEEVTKISYHAHDAGEKDHRTTLVKLIHLNATALILLTHSDECPQVYNQLIELNYKPQLYLFLQSFVCGSAKNSEEYPQLLTNAYGVDVFFDETSPDYNAFKKRLKESATHHIGSAMAYDSIMEMAKAYDGCENSLCAIQKLKKLKYDGLTGDLQYDGQIVNRQIALTRYEDGRWVRLE